MLSTGGEYNEIIVSVCYYHTEMLPDFIGHTRRKGIEVRNKLDISAAEKELERSIRNEDLLRLMQLQKIRTMST